MVKPQFLVSAFDKKLISLLISQCFDDNFPDISSKRQIAYIHSYLAQLNCKTIVCETKYIDKNFLDDYSAYYLRCFTGYPSHCARLHFFSTDFNVEDLQGRLFESDSKATKEFQKSLALSYLGFMVVRPIPKTPIGRTCLKVQTDLSDDASRKKSIAKKYNTNLFGVSLEVDSIAFQEQDKVIAACATTSLWTMLHAIDHVPIGTIPSQSEITKVALSGGADLINGFPNQGLSEEQVISALEAMSLKLHEFKIINDDDESYEIFLTQLQTFLDSDIPVFLGTELYEEKDGLFSNKGDHAVVITGYRLSLENKVDRLYIHDDRFGPFVKSDIIKVNLTPDDHPCSVLSIKLNSPNGEHHKSTQFLKPVKIIVGSYPKIRIPFDLIYFTCLDFKKTILNFYEGSVKFDFSIKIMLSSSLKKEYLNSRVSNKKEVLSTNMSRYVWVVKMKLDGLDVLDLIFDSTDLPQGRPLLIYAINNKAITRMLFDHLIEDYKDLPLSELSPDEWVSFYPSIMQTILERRSSNTFSDDLDLMYGSLRPPKYLQDTEIQDFRLRQQDNVHRILSSYAAVNLDSIYSSRDNNTVIWLIDENGYLVIGKDYKVPKQGHPTLIASGAARIAGELYRDSDGYYINSFSGRYSSLYSDDDKAQFMDAALAKFIEVFGLDHSKIRVLEERPDE